MGYQPHLRRSVLVDVRASFNSCKCACSRTVPITGHRVAQNQRVHIVDKALTLGHTKVQAHDWTRSPPPKPPAWLFGPPNQSKMEVKQLV